MFFFGKAVSITDSRLAFIFFTISMPIIMFLGATHNRYISSRLIQLDDIPLAVRRARLIRKNNIFLYYLLSALIFNVLVYVIYGSYILTTYSIFITISCSVLNMSLLPFIVIRNFFWRIFFGANLGTLGLIAVVFSFSAEMFSRTEATLVIVICIVAGVVAVISNKYSSPYVDAEYNDYYRFHGDGTAHVILSSIGKPVLFVAFHCIRAAGPFMASVSLILLNVAICRQFLPEALVSAGAIMLTCFVFFSGATTLAGAGIFAFGTVVALSIYMLLSPEMLLSVWSPAFMLWIVLPLLNAVVDCGRWSIARHNLRLLSKAKSPLLPIIFTELIASAASYVLYVVIVFFVISIFTATAAYYGQKTPFDVDFIVAKLDNNIFENGIWLLFMAGTILIPTAIQAILILHSGFVNFFPRKYRSKLALQLELSSSVMDEDSLAWRLAVLDILSRVIVVACVILSFGLIVINVSPALGKGILLCVHAGVSFGKSASNWLFALS